MKSNQFFSPQRYVMLLRYDLIINYKRYIFTALGALIVGFLLLYSAMPSKLSLQHFPIEAYTPMFMLSLLAIGAFIGLSFPEAGNKINLTRYLMLPASTIEKFVAQFSIRIVMGLALFLGIFWVDAQLARIIIAKGAASFGMVSQIEPFSYAGFWEYFITDSSFLIFILMIFAIGFYLFSSRLFFGKFGLVKALIVLSVLGYVFTLLMVLFSHIFYPNTIGFDVKLPSYEMYKGFENTEIFALSLAALSIVTLLPLGYFKLKEKQL